MCLIELDARRQTRYRQRWSKRKKNIPGDFFPAATADDEIREKTNKIRVSCIRSVTVSRRGRRGRLLGSMPVDNLGIVLGGCWKKRCGCRYQW